MQTPNQKVTSTSLCKRIKFKNRKKAGMAPLPKHLSKRRVRWTRQVQYSKVNVLTVDNHSASPSQQKSGEVITRETLELEQTEDGCDKSSEKVENKVGKLDVSSGEEGSEEEKIILVEIITGAVCKDFQKQKSTIAGRKSKPFDNTQCTVADDNTRLQSKNAH